MSVFDSLIQRSKGSEHRMEDDRNIEYNIPAELYKIEPSQFVLFVSKEGFDQEVSKKINDLFSYLHHLDIKDVKMNMVTTEDDEYLIGNMACRNTRETTNPYKVAIGSWRTIAGLIGHYAGIPINEVVEKLSPISEQSCLSLSTTDLPDIVSINPKDCPSKPQHSVPDCSLCPYIEEGGINGMEALSTKKQPQEELENKISSVLADCERFGYDVDTTALKDKIRAAWEHPIEYDLILDLQYKARRKGYEQSEVLGVCDIYIEGNGETRRINLRPAEKALYLTNILRGGFPLANMSMDVLKDMAAIFSKIPDRQEREEGIKTLQQSLSGIGVMKKRIKDAFSVAVDFGPDANKLAMEGFAGKEVSIRKATDKHREQIKKYFGL